MAVSRLNLRRTFGIVAAIMALGVLWLALGGGKGQPGGPDSIGAAAAPTQSLGQQTSVAATGLNLPAPELSVAYPHQAASLTSVATTSGSGDNLGALMWAAVGAVCLSILVLSLAWKQRTAAAPATREEMPAPHVISRLSSY